MPTHLFHELNDDKRQTIISVGIAEFAKHGYAGSSTNRIVKAAGISKGSLFKYFENKEALYFYLLDRVTEELVSSLSAMRGALPDDLFARVIQYSEFEFSWYIQNPEKYRLIIQAFSDKDTGHCQKAEARFYYAGQDIYHGLLADVNMEPYPWSKQKIVDILRWFLQGFNKDFIGRIEVQMGSTLPIDSIRDEYVKCLTDYLEVLKKGFCRTGG